MTTTNHIDNAIAGRINANCDRCDTFGPITMDEATADFVCDACSIAADVKAHNWNTARAKVRKAALAGRAYIDAADHHNGGVARIQIDDREVGTASTLLFFNYKTTTGRSSGVIVPTYDYRYNS